jgi:hypothetical protein
VAGRIEPIEKSSDLMRIRKCDLPACSIMSQNVIWFSEELGGGALKVAGFKISVFYILFFHNGLSCPCQKIYGLQLQAWFGGSFSRGFLL